MKKQIGRLSVGDVFREGRITRRVVDYPPFTSGGECHLRVQRIYPAALRMQPYTSTIHRDRELEVEVLS